MAPSLRALCPAAAAGFTPTPRADLSGSWPRCAPSRCAARVYDARARAPACTISPVALADLLFDADYDPRCAPRMPAAVRRRSRGDGAPLPG